MAECRIRIIEGLGLATVSARRGRAEAASSAAEHAFGIALPSTPQLARGQRIAFAWCGPAQWLAIADAQGVAAAGDIESLLAPVFEGTATVCEQSDARCVVEIAGTRARAVLAKGLPLDLHPRAFAPGDVALSVISHIAVMLWQVDQEPTFRLAVPRGYAGSFRHWLDESAAEFDPVYG